MSITAVDYYFMARTQRQIVPHLWRKPHLTQRDRRQYFAALEQGVHLTIRARRKPKQLPDERAELSVSAGKEITGVFASWLGNQVGQSWAAVYARLAKFPLAKHSGSAQWRLKQLSKKLVQTRVFMQGSTALMSGSWGGDRSLCPGAFFVHPQSGLLCRQPVSMHEP